MNQFAHTVIQRKEKDVRIFSTGEQRGELMRLGLYSVFFSYRLFQFNIDANTFYSWIVQNLLPKVPKGSITVMNNASFHKCNDIRDVIEKTGCVMAFLPPYSPDLNSIEHNKWTQLKAIRRKKRCSLDEIFTD